jgi:hypothetical protein
MPAPAVIAYKNESGTEVLSVDQDGNLVVTGTVSSTSATPDDFGAAGIKADVIAESTSGAGVTVDGLLLKDGFVVATDAQGIKLGTGVDDTIGHDGTLTTWTHTTGDLVIDNTDTNDQIILRVGTDTTATGVEFRNNSDASVWKVEPTSATAGRLVGVDSSALIFGTGLDISIAWDGTDLVVSQAAPDSIVKWGVDAAGINHVFYGDTTLVTMTWDQTNDQLLFADNAKLAIGSGAGAAGDITFSWGGTRMNVNQLTANSAIWWGVDGDGIDQIFYGDTASATMTWDQSADSLLFTGASKLVMNDGSLLQQKGAGTGTGDVIHRIGATETEGMEVRVYEAVISPAAIETALFTVPADSVIDSVQANVATALTGGGTTVTFGFGITGDVDLYGTAFSAGAQADLLTQNAKVNAIGTKTNAGAGIGVYNPAAVSLKLIGAATGGASAGDTALTVGTVRVVVRYRVLISLANA